MLLKKELELAKENAKFLENEYNKINQAKINKEQVLEAEIQNYKSKLANKEDNYNAQTKQTEE